ASSVGDGAVGAGPTPPIAPIAPVAPTISPTITPAITPEPTLIAKPGAVSDQPTADQPPVVEESPTGTAGFGTTSQQTILDILLADASISAEQKQTIEVEHISSGKSLEALVEEKGMVSEEVFTR